MSPYVAVRVVRRPTTTGMSPFVVRRILLGGVFAHPRDANKFVQANPGGGRTRGGEVLPWSEVPAEVQTKLLVAIERSSRIITEFGSGRCYIGTHYGGRPCEVALSQEVEPARLTSIEVS